MKQKAMWIYRHFKNTNLKISLKTNNFPERNQILTKTTCTKWKPMTGKWCKPVLIAAISIIIIIIIIIINCNWLVTRWQWLFYM